MKQLKNSNYFHMNDLTEVFYKLGILGVMDEWDLDIELSEYWRKKGVNRWDL